MTRDEVIATLKAHQPELMAMGILHAGLFGSVARGEQGPESDIDILIDIDANLKMGVFEYAGIKRQVGEFFPVSADVVNKKFLRPYVREAVDRDLIRAF